LTTSFPNEKRRKGSNNSALSLSEEKIYIEGRGGRRNVARLFNVADCWGVEGKKKAGNDGNGRKQKERGEGVIGGGGGGLSRCGRSCRGYRSKKGMEGFS